MIELVKGFVPQMIGTRVKLTKVEKKDDKVTAEREIYGTLQSFSQYGNATGTEIVWVQFEGDSEAYELTRSNVEYDIDVKIERIRSVGAPLQQPRGGF